MILLLLLIFFLYFSLSFFSSVLFYLILFRWFVFFFGFVVVVCLSVCAPPFFRVDVCVCASVCVYTSVCVIYIYIEGSRPEWRISSMIYSRAVGLPVWSETLDIYLSLFIFSSLSHLSYRFPPTRARQIHHQAGRR